MDSSWNGLSHEHTMAWLGLRLLGKIWQKLVQKVNQTEYLENYKG